MVQSINTKSEYHVDATCFRGMSVYGQVLIGDVGFEFYSLKNVNDFVQIPWTEVKLVIADVYFKGRYIPRFKIQTRNSGDFIFATRHPKDTLRAIRKHVLDEKMRKSRTFWQIIKNFLKR